MDEGKKRGRPPKGPNTVSFELNQMQAHLVGILCSRGTYGDNVTEVVKHSLNEYLKSLQVTNVLPLDVHSAQIHSISSLEPRPDEAKGTKLASQGTK